MEMGNSALPDAQTSRSLPLERKLPLLILGVLAFVLALSLGVSYYAVRRAAQQAASERLVTVSTVLAQMLQQQLAQRLGLMHRVAADTSIVNALRAPDRPLSAAA